MNARIVLAAMCVLSVSNSCLADPVPVLGLSIGGQFPKSVRVCPPSVDEPKSVCWLEAPYVDKNSGGRIGHIKLPNADGRPRWAAYALFEVSLDKAMAVESLKVKTSSFAGRHEIATSISSRFGLPDTSSLPREDYAGATWRSGGLLIQLVCGSQHGCSTEFTQPSVRAKDQEAANTREAKRPAGP